jgi:hypothetical protein
MANTLAFQQPFRSPVRIFTVETVAIFKRPSGITERRDETVVQGPPDRIGRMNGMKSLLCKLE